MNNNQIPDRDEEILRVLYANAFSNLKTKEAFEIRDLYYEQSCPIYIYQSTFSILFSGIIYIHGRDKNLRPLVFISVQHLLTLKVDVLTTLALLVHEYISKHLLVVERVENYNLIFDMTNVSVSYFPFVTFSAVLETLSKLYMCKINRVICLNV